MEGSSRQKTLREWVLLNAAKPLYATLTVIVAVQIFFVIAKIQTSRVELRRSVSNLSNVISVGMFQKNRMLIETSATYALSGSEILQICIFDQNKMAYSLPLKTSGICEPDNYFLQDEVQIQLRNIPQYQVRFIVPRFPGLSSILLFVSISLLLSFSVFFVLFALLKKIKKELILPLNKSIENLDILDKNFDKREFFEIKELDHLLKSYFQKMIQVKSLMEKEVELSKEALVGRISAQLTHDMRAPIGTFERLLFISPEDFPKMKEAIRESVNRLYTMVEALRHAEVENIVRKTWTALDFSFGRQALQWKAESHKITLEVPMAKIENIHIDQAKVERAWINLVSNALEFAKSIVRVEVEYQTSNLLIRVLDDGQGVPEEFLPKLFQRGATYGKAEGTGLGLAYVKQIAQGHGGDIRYSRLDGWTIFEIFIPNALSTGLTSKTTDEIQEVTIAQTLEVKRVAICLQPEILNQEILAGLSDLASHDFTFSDQREGASIVVSNSEEIMFEVIENDDQEYFSLAQYKDHKDFMIEILKRKFQLS